MSRFLSRLLAAAAVVFAPVAGAQTQATVTVAVPVAATVNDELHLTGTLTAERNARLSPRVDGLVATVKVDAGDRVKAGDTLLELDAALARHALTRMQAGSAEARARLAESERLVAEARNLIGEGHIPHTEAARRESDIALARAALAAAEAAERELAEQVRRHVLPAPFAGVIARKLTEVGEWVTRGTPVLELVATDRVRLDVQAPQERFARIDAGARVQVQADALPGEVLPARIAARVPVSDASARTFLVRLLVEDPDGRLLPGTSATAVIDLSGSRTALLVPRDALLRYPDGSHSVFVVESAGGRNVVQERRVSIGRGGAQVEILDGLDAGEQVVVRGNENLQSGQAVRISGGS